MDEQQESGRILRQKERKHYTEDAINDEEIEGKRMFSVEEKLKSDSFSNYFVKDMKGDEFCLKYIQEHGFETPTVIHDKAGLGMRLPSKNFTVNDVRQCVGSRRMLDVMDVTTQKDIEMSMKDWVKYYENPVRDKLLNVISLEFSHTKLENYVESPTLVREIDWVDRVWPRHLKQSQTEATNIIEDMKYPKVQKYCLMSVKGCYTDFHIDFGGTSVWYHILHGSKVFWLIPPTERNLQLYETWVLSGKQGDVFFGDTVEKCERIHLEEGWTFFIPTGWIHAVYTPQDSLVFGGNFLHSFGIEKQLRIAQIEDSTHVPTKFRYPFYTEMLWYVLERYIHCLLGRTHLYPVEEDEADENVKSREIKREKDGVERPNGVMITPPDSPHPPNGELVAATSAVNAEQHCIGNPQIAHPVVVSTTPMSGKPKVNNPAMQYGKFLGYGELPLFGQHLALGGPHLAPRPDISSSELKVDATNVEAVRRILDGVSRLNPPIPYISQDVPAVATPNQRPHVHLTRLEINGLKTIMNWLTSLPNSKKNIPDLLRDPAALLADARLLLELHQNDDPRLSITGQPVLFWPDSPKVVKSPIILKIRPTKPRSSQNTPSKGKSGGSSSKNSSARRRRTRCKKCEACLRTDCGECHFCKDMRKFGGPGRMKQSCISRQCMAPVLPHTACCMVCGKDGWEKIENSEEEVSSLMECSICWEIVHPDCIRSKLGRADGILNEDLPNSWECPRCCCDGKGGQTKPRQVKGARHKSIDGRLSGDNSNPEIVRETKDGIIEKIEVPEEVNDSSKLAALNKRKLNEPDSPLIKKKIKTEEPTEHPLELRHSPRMLEGSQNISPLPQLVISPEVAPDREEITSPKTDDKKRKKPDTPTSKISKSDSEAHVRSCSQGRPDDRAQRMSPRLPVARQGSPQLRPRSPRILAAQNNNCQNKAPENKGPDALKHRGIMKCEVKVEKCDAADLLQKKRRIGGSLNSTPLSRTSNESVIRSGRPPNSRGNAQNPTRVPPRVVANGKTPLRKPLYVVRPAPIMSERTRSEHRERHNSEVNYAIDKDVMMGVFRYLSRSDLCRCMLVCREWNQWCLDSKLWLHIDLTRQKITAQHLAGLVRRQPTSLILAWTNISKKLLSWLVARLPRLRQLDLNGCSASAATALRTCSCPLLTSVELRFIEGFTDTHLRDLLSPPPDSRPGLIESRTRLRNLNRLCLSGCDITDVALRYITQHLRLLTHLDISHCTKITDAGVSLLGAVGTVTRDTLTHLDLSGCKKLTDACFEHLRRCPNLIYIDLRSCPDVSTAACKKFLSQNKLGLIMSKSKLLEKP